MFPLPFRVDSTRANLVWATSVQVIEKLAGYAVIAALTRTLTTVDIGRIFFASTVSGIAATVLSFGTEHHLIRAVATQPEKAVSNLGEVLSMRLQNMLVVYTLVNLGFWLIQPSLGPTLMLVTAYDFLEEIYYTFSAFFTGQKRLIYRLAIGAVIKILTVGAVSAGAYLTRSLYFVLLTYLFVDIGLVIGTFWIVRRDFGPIQLHFGWRRHLGLMRASLPFFLFSILTIVHLRLDTLMVGLMLSLVQVAYYDLGLKMLEVARFVIRPLYSVFYPIFSEMAAQQRWKRLRLRTLQLTGAAFGLGILVMLGMQVLGSFVIVLLFGTGYEASAMPAKILFLSAPLIYVHSILTIPANALHLERESAWLLGASAFINLILNIFAIPRYGIVGAAWVTLASQALLTVSMLWVTASKLIKPKSA